MREKESGCETERMTHFPLVSTESDASVTQQRRASLETSAEAPGEV